MSLTPEEKEIVNRALGPEEPDNGGNGHARSETEIIQLEIVRLAVNFREVVHSVRTGNADVAKP